MKKLELEKMEKINGGKSYFENVQDCVTDAYSNHGAASWFAGAVSALSPIGFFAYSAACAGRNL